MELPEDIYAGILKRLPVKSLARFRCVCKSWHRLITSPSFIQLHLRFNRRNRIILSRFCDTLLSLGPEDTSALPPTPNNNTISGFEEAVELDFDLVRNLPYYVKGQCDGLLCLVIKDGGDGALVIWNPCIREYKRLPLPQDFRSTREVLGLGYDSSTGDYKVVRAPSNYCRVKCRDYQPQVQVLSLRSSSWRKIPDQDTPPFFIEHFLQATAVNGGIYWLGEPEGAVLRWEILRFDLAKEKFKVVQPPPRELDRRNSIPWLGPLEGSLCVVRTQRLSFFDVWTTKDDETWTKLFTIPSIPGPEAYVLGPEAHVPLCFTKSGAVLIGVRGVGLATYHPSENKLRRLAVDGVDRWFQEIACAETLVSPHATARQLQEHHRTSHSLWQLFNGFKDGIAGYFSCSSGEMSRLR
ncbi:F-box protein CPR30 [Morella rubra]|uniref:F-box protein CPR30 n=1 Tax=Morella rubra TaxID=262757 RepID=A0A6A1W197_9ROSI|nr:F-box protein CPR30 [Morella rubra]